MHESNAEFVRSRTYPFCRQFLHEHELERSLLKSKTHLVGTFRANRKHLPKVVMHAKLKRGEIAAQEYQKGVVVLKWKDVRDVRVLSTKHKPELEDPSSRRMRARTEVAEVRQEEEEDNEATDPGPSQARKRKRGGRQKKTITIHAYNKGKSELKHCVQPPYLWSTPLRSTVHQFGVAVHTLASSIVFSTTHCALSLDACVQLQQTIYPSSQVSSRLSFAD